MTLISTTLGGKPVRLRCLPEPWPEFEYKFKRFCESDDVFGLDVETTSITETAMFDPDANMRLIQFGTARGAWVLDPHHEFWRPLVAEFLASSRRFVTHTNYDPLWCLREFDIDLAAAGRSIDTIVLANLLDPGPPPVGKPKDLKSLTTRHVGPELAEVEAKLHAHMKELAPKGQRAGRNALIWGWNELPADDELFCTYAGLDAVAVRVVLDVLAAKVPPRSRKLARREQRVARLATGMRHRGHLVDRERAEAVLGDVEATFDAAHDRLHEVFGFPPLSYVRRAEWLKAKGILFPAYTDSGNPKTDKDNLPLLLNRYGEDPEIGPIFRDIDILSKNINLRTNLRACVHNTDARGAIHPEINVLQAVTGRMSVTGVAMQTFKKDDKRLRGIFLARPGHVFVGADYDSQEIRLAYAYSRDAALGEVLRQGVSQHVITAQLIFGSRFVSKEETPREYGQAKILNFAQQYGAGPKRIAFQLNIGYAEARELWLAWRHAYAGLVAWTERMAELPMVVNPWGRRIPRDRYRHYANGNYKIQSSGRDLLGDALVNLADDGWAEMLWLPIHDEIITEVPEGDAQRAAKALEECMYAKVLGVELPATATVLGARWSGEAA